MARRALCLLTVLATEASTVVLLHALARVDGLGGPGADPAGWLRSASPEGVVAGGIRLAALAGAWWLLASTAVYAVAQLARVPAAARAVGWVVLPGARRWVDRALGVSMLTSVALGTTGLGGAVAHAGEPPATVEVRDGRAVGSIPDPAPPPTTPPAPDPSPVPAESPPPAPTAPPPATTQHVVAPGDSLWTIAADHVAGTEIDSYWVRLVEANRDALRSGNPNLIYAGEVIELPALG
ncbi:MAG: LysM peptidoglycan-binding domain-containing protein [Actinomycetota bacterium]